MTDRGDMQKQKQVRVLGGYHNDEVFPAVWEATHLHLFSPGTTGVAGGTPIKHLIVWSRSGWYALHPITGPARFAEILKQEEETQDDGIRPSAVLGVATGDSSPEVAG